MDPGKLPKAIAMSVRKRSGPLMSRCQSRDCRYRAFLQDPEGNNDGWRDRQAALFAELEAAHNEAAN